MYEIILVVCGVVFPVTEALKRQWHTNPYVSVGANAEPEVSFNSSFFFYFFIFFRISHPGSTQRILHTLRETLYPSRSYLLHVLLHHVQTPTLVLHVLFPWQLHLQQLSDMSIIPTSHIAVPYQSSPSVLLSEPVRFRCPCDVDIFNIVPFLLALFPFFNE